jgi:16S rRNA (cytidine1402-2'-O)-methyltransferase
MGRLTIAAAPLGNFRDASARLRDAISKAQFVAAEDSRKFARLCSDLEIKCEAKVISFFEGNEKDRLSELESALQNFENVLLITDAGMPGVSDPGYRAVVMAIENNFDIEVLPGPSAVTMALVLSGLPTDRFLFEGFLPRTEGARAQALANLGEEERTMIFFEAPHRIGEFLDAALKEFGSTRLAAICREMTKTYEEVVRGTLAELKSWSDSKEMLGEFTIVIAGFKPSETEHTESEIVNLVNRYEAAGIARKEAISMVAKELAIPKRSVFDVMVKNK